MKNYFSIKSALDTEFETDYEFAIIHLLWLKDKDMQNNLIFGMVECYPKEILTAYELEEQCEIFNDYQLHYIRIRKKASDAIMWYTACMEKGFLEINWNRISENNRKIFCGDFVGLTKWPNFSLTSSENEVTPFVSKEWGVVRSYHLFPKERRKKLFDFIDHEEIANWINNFLLWDINKFRELLGSLHLVLPNPIYRTRSQRLILGDKDENDIIKVEFIPRKERNVKELQLYSLEKNSIGIAGGHCITVNSNVIYLQQSGQVEECGFIICCPERGPIDYSPFSGFIRGINFKIDIGDVSGNIDSYSGSNHTRLEKQNVIEKKFDQKVFLNDRERAKDFIRDKFEGAKEKVIIVEPDFSPEFLTFVSEVRPKTIQIQVLTISSSIEQELYTQLCKENDIRVFLMPEQVFIQDRLFIIDNEVWLLGSSLKNIGEGMSIIVRVPYSAEILERINQLINDRKSIIMG